MHESVRVCLPGLKCIRLKSSSFCVCKDTHIDAQRKDFLETFHNHLCTYLPLRVPLRPPVSGVLLLAISQALPPYFQYLHVNSFSFLASFLLSYLAFLPRLLPTGPFPFAWPNTVKHGGDNERSLVFPGCLLLNHATALCLASTLTFMFSIRHSSEEPRAPPPSPLRKKKKKP